MGQCRRISEPVVLEHGWGRGTYVRFTIPHLIYEMSVLFLQPLQGR